MSLAKQLREQRAALVAKARAEILEPAEKAGRDLTAEEAASWEKIMGGVRPDGTAVRGEVDALMDRIQRAEQADRLEAEAAAMSARSEDVRRVLLAGTVKGSDGAELALADPDQRRTAALQAWIQYQMGRDPTDLQMEAARREGLRLHARELNLACYSTADYERLRHAYASVHPTLRKRSVQDFRATMSPTSGPAGGYTIPPETLIRNLEVNLLAFGGIRQVAETMVTATGEPMTWPTVDDTANKGRRIDVNKQVNTATDPTFGKATWGAFKYTSDAVLVPSELLQDTVFDLPGTLGDLLGTRIGRVTNDEYTTGTGGVMPRGLVTAAGTFNAAGAAAITGDDLLGLYHSIDPAYRGGDNFGWMMNDALVLAIRKLKESTTNAYMWQPGLQDGVPDRLLGYGITLNQSMDSTMASGKKTVLCGPFRRYKIRRAGGIRMYRLQERYRDNDQDAFLCFVREDGNLLEAGTKPIKVLVHP